MVDLPPRTCIGLPPEAARATESRGLLRGRLWLPPLVSGALVGWLVWRVSPRALLEAAARLDLAVVAPATLGLVAALYLWDAVCLRWLFAQSRPGVAYATALRARGTSYLAGVVNYELGQAAAAWLMARRLGIGLVPALGCFVVLGLHDVAALLSLGLIGSLGGSDARAAALRPWCAAGLAVLLLGLALARRAPRSWRQRLAGTRWGAALSGWRCAQSLRLYGLRVAYFGITLLYAAAGLGLCGVAVDRGVVLGVIPLVLLADGLPVSVSGLGTRETALLFLLRPEHPEVVLAWSLAWSAGLLVGRAGIGLASLWLGEPPAERKEDQP
jgi:hypothetical protein